MRILIVPNGFKGTLSAPEAAEAIRQGILKTCPTADCRLFPLADGGQGSSEIIGALLGAERFEKQVLGPEGETVLGFYYLQSSNAYLELAAASGFTQSKRPKQTALRATTFGTGQLIRDAVERGAEHVYLFLGGSATSDGGVGMAKALGAVFFDELGIEMPPASEFAEQAADFPGERLSEIGEVMLAGVPAVLAGARVTALVDVDNPLFGPRGAAYIYGPQKGLAPEEVALVDKGLASLACHTAASIDEDLSQSPGAGAAGGAGFGVLALLGGALYPGSHFFLEQIHFEDELREADLVVTGEGKCDVQSIQGKLLGEVLTRCTNAGKPLLALCGRNDLSPQELAEHPVLTMRTMDRPDSMTNAFEVLREVAQDAAREIVQESRA